MGTGDRILEAVLAASCRLSQGDLRNKTPNALAPAVNEIVTKLCLRDSGVAWVNAYVDMERDGRFPAEVVDVAKTLYGIVPFEGSIKHIHEQIFARIQGNPHEGLTDLLARPEVPEESILSRPKGADAKLTLRDASNSEIAVSLEAVSWYRSTLFADEFAEYQYVHIKHPDLGQMRRTLAVNCCGAYIMCRAWKDIRWLVYPTLRAFVLELGARVSHWLAGELADEHRRQKDVAEMVHRRAASATRAFGEAARSLTMLRDLVAPEVAIFSGAHELRRFFETSPSQALNSRVSLPCAHDWVLTDGELVCKDIDTKTVVREKPASEVCAAQTVGILLTVIGAAEDARKPICKFARTVFEARRYDRDRLVEAMGAFLPLTEPLDSAAPTEIIKGFRFARRCFHELHKFGEFKLDACPLFFFAHAVWMGDVWKWGETALASSGRQIADLLAETGVSIPVSSSRGIDTITGLHHVINRYGGLRHLELGDESESFIRLTLVEPPVIRNPGDLVSRVSDAYRASREGEIVRVGDHTQMFLELMGAAAESVKTERAAENEWVFTGTRPAESSTQEVSIKFNRDAREFKISWSGP